MNFCPRCGKPLADRERFGRMRRACDACGFIHFRDPAVAVVVLAVREGRALMVHRAVEPQIGAWAFPAGFVDYGEDPREAAVREVKEETGLDVKLMRLIDVLGPDTGGGGKAAIIIMFKGEITGGEPTPGDDADQVAFFAPEEVPRDRLVKFASVQVLIDVWLGMAR